MQPVISPLSLRNTLQQGRLRHHAQGAGPPLRRRYSCELGKVGLGNTYAAFMNPLTGHAYVASDDGLLLVDLFGP